MREAMQSGQHLHRDIEIADRDFSVTFTPIEGEGYINIYAHDISARKTAERSLQWELDVNSALAKLAQELLAQPGDIATIAGTVLAYAKEITNSRHGMVSSVDRQTGRNVFHTFTEMTGKAAGWVKKTSRQPSTATRMAPIPVFGAIASKAGMPFSPMNRKPPPGQGVAQGHVSIQSFLTVPC